MIGSTERPSLRGIGRARRGTARSVRPESLRPLVLGHSRILAASVTDKGILDRRQTTTEDADGTTARGLLRPIAARSRERQFAVLNPPRRTRRHRRRRTTAQRRSRGLRCGRGCLLRWPPGPQADAGLQDSPIYPRLLHQRASISLIRLGWRRSPWPSSALSA